MQLKPEGFYFLMRLWYDLQKESTEIIDMNSCYYGILICNFIEFIVFFKIIHKGSKILMFHQQASGFILN